MSSRTHYSHIADLFKIDTNNYNSNQFKVSQIRENTFILDRRNNWIVLLFKEAIMIKEHWRSLNCALTASKESQLFLLHLNGFIRLLIHCFNIKLIFLLFNVLITLID